MGQTLSALIVVILAGTLAGIGAQVRPDFSGNWVLTSSTPEGTAALGTEFMISQDAQAIQINLVGIGFRSASSGPGGTEMRYPVRITYELDGVEHPTKSISEPPLPPPAPPRAGVMTSRTEESISKATWAGDQLVIMLYNKSRTIAPDRTPASVLTRQTVRQALSLDAQGSLVVESLIVADPSPWGRKSTSPTPVRSIYKKN